MTFDRVALKEVCRELNRYANNSGVEYQARIQAMFKKHGTRLNDQGTDTDRPADEVVMLKLHGSNT